MIQILFNYNCNLCCSYCFEKDLWSKKEKITPDELRTILSFLGHESTVTITGGEPTMHPQFLQLLSVLREFPSNEYYLLTNGLFHPTFTDEIMNTFKIVVFNLNDPKGYSKENWNIVQKSLETLARQDSPCWVQIGMNIQQKEQRFEYLIPIMKFYEVIKELRVSFIHPNICKSNKFLNFDQLKEAASSLLDLVALAVMHDFSVSLACPIMPCLFTKEQLEFLTQYSSNFRFWGCPGNMIFHPGLKVGHCFGSYPDLYELSSFKNAPQIEQIIREKEEKLMFDKASFKQCNQCFFKNNRTCQGGCLSYSIDISIRKI